MSTGNLIQFWYYLLPRCKFRHFGTYILCESPFFGTILDNWLKTE